jgi:hypothetical protein
MSLMVLFAMGMIAVEVIPKDSCEPGNADVTGIRSVPNVASEFQNEAVSGQALWTHIEVPQVTEVGARPQLTRQILPKLQLVLRWGSALRLV